MLLQYFLLVLLWLIYFIVHSLLVSQRAKQYFEAQMGEAFRYYRLFYNIIATVSLLGIMFYSAILSSKLLLPASWLPIVRFIGLTFAIWGVLVLRLAFKKYSMKEFLGIAQASNETDTVDKLQTGGILQFVRHPIYSATLLLIWGFWLFSPTLVNLISMILVSAYVVIGMRLEEKKLIAHFGEAYLQYQERVPALIPTWHSLKKIF